MSQLVFACDSSTMVQFDKEKMLSAVHLLPRGGSKSKHLDRGRTSASICGLVWFLGKKLYTKQTTSINGSRSERVRIKYVPCDTGKLPRMICSMPWDCGGGISGAFWSCCFEPGEVLHKQKVSKFIETRRLQMRSGGSKSKTNNLTRDLLWQKTLSTAWKSRHVG